MPTGLAATSTCNNSHHTSGVLSNSDATAGTCIYVCTSYPLSASIALNQLNAMEPLSQLDVTNPDHVSVITRDGKVTISVLKDGTSVTLGFQIRNLRLDSSPRPPLQQSTPMAVKEGDVPRESSTGLPKYALKTVKYSSEAELKRAREMGRRFKTKLTEQQVIELKQILADESIMSQFSSKTFAYKQLGQIYGVSGCRIQQIANGDGWKHIKV